MQTIAINENNDIYLDSSGNLAIKTDLAAMGDIIVNKCQTNQGELLFNNIKGIDFFNTIFNSPAYPDLFQNQVLREIEQTDKVQQINSYTSDIDIKNNLYSYKTEIQTDYGVLNLNG